MRILFFCLAICVGAVTMSTSAQSGILKNADKQFDKGAYPKAARLYTEYLETTDDAATKVKLAECHYLMRQPAEAEKWYVQVIPTVKQNPETLYHYGQVLKSLKKYEEAKMVFQLYDKGTGKAANQIEACKKANTFLEDPGIYKIDNISINSARADFAPAYYRNGIVYSTEENRTTKEYNRREQPFLDLMYAEQTGSNALLMGMPVEFAFEGVKVNSKLHDGAVSFSKDFKTAYLTRNRKLATKGATTQLEIIEITNAPDGSTIVAPMPFNSDDYSCGHPSLSADGQRLFFVSNMPNGQGGTDIWLTERSRNGNWGTPRNLGPEINTMGNEMFPFIAADNTLYFASDEWPGLGGYDLFKALPTDKNNWGQPENLHAPINTNADDFAMIVASGGGRGFFTSNRAGGKGDDDIYAFTANQTKCEVRGQITDLKTGAAIANANIKIVSYTNGSTKTTNTNSNGTYTLGIDCADDYTIFASSTGYLTGVRSLSRYEMSKTKPTTVDIALSLAPEADPITGDFKSPIKIISGRPNNYPGFELPEINHIYYDLDKFDLRPEAKVELNKIVSFMLANPTLRVQLGSHTDSRGDNAYNLDLSEKRAKSAIDYIIASGVPKKNISGKGYGETQLVNGCKDGTQCAEEQHQQNRRTEFLITGYVKE